MTAASYSCLMASTGLAVAALMDWKPMVKKAKTRAETNSVRERPKPRF